jgi:hypothetical protein
VQGLGGRHIQISPQQVLFLLWGDSAGPEEAGPAALLLTHFSTSLEDPDSFLENARCIFEKTWTAKDGGTVTLRYPAEKEKAWISLS